MIETVSTNESQIPARDMQPDKPMQVADDEGLDQKAPRRASSRRRASTFGMAQLKSASSFGLEIDTHVSRGTMAKIVAGGCALLQLVSLVATSATLGGGVAGYSIVYSACRTGAMLSTFLLSYDARIHPGWLAPGTPTFALAWLCAFRTTARSSKFKPHHKYTRRLRPVSKSAKPRTGRPGS